MNDRISDREEVFFTNCSANDCDSFNNLSTELFKFRSAESNKLFHKELKGTLEIWSEFFFHFLGTSSHGCSSILFDHGNSFFNQIHKDLAALFNDRFNNIRSCMLKEISQCCTSMSGDTRYLIIHRLNESRNNSRMVILLEIVWHIIGQLTNSMEGCMSDFWISMH